MGVYVAGMMMPKSCGECDVICKNFQHGWDIPPEYEYKRHPDCPLVEVKEPHGRLIDADAVTREMLADIGKRSIRIDTAITVLEAEG